MLGSYHSRHYKQLASDQPVMVDFRSVRFPGLISAYTLPTGGTSDYAPEMLHAAARGEDYDCFVDDDVRIPFMAMPDATNALIRLAKAPRENLTRVVYNVTSFSLSASEIRHIVVRSFPKASIKFKPDKKRQAIVDSWPADLDDSMARRDWEWEPSYNKDACFCDYLIPNIKKRYQS